MLRPRILRIDPTVWNEPLFVFLKDFWNVFGRHPHSLVFGDPGHLSESAFLTALLKTALEAVDVAPPPGQAYTSHSLRSCAATAAFSIGVQLPRILAFGGWKLPSSAQRYIDPLARASDAARFFFGHLL